MVIALATGAVSMRVSGIPFAMVTLAFAQAGSVLVRRNSQITGGEEGLSLNTDQVPDFLIGVINTRNLYWLTLAVLVIVYLVTLWVDTSRLGHLARATRENEQRVRVLGPQPYAREARRLRDRRRCSRASPESRTCCCSRAPCRARSRPI